MSKLITENKDSGGNVTSRTQVEYRYDNSGIRFIAVDTTDGTPATPTVDGSPSGRTEYLIDHSNFTGYAQTIIETKYNTLGTTERISYTFGADEITQTVAVLTSGGSVSGTPVTSVFGHDGHGSVRALFAATAAFAQVYSYTAYGELMAIHNATAGIVSGGPAALADASAASTRMLYNGEGLDTRTGLYNFRARWYSASNARFERLDPFAGNPNDPFSFNKYGFVHGDPIGMSDPTGNFAGLALYAGLIAGTLAKGAALATIWNTVGARGAEMRNAGIELLSQGIMDDAVFALLKEGGRLIEGAAQLSEYADKLIDVAELAIAALAIVIDRVSRSSVRVERPALTCAYAIQPSVIKGLAKNLFADVGCWQDFCTRHQRVGLAYAAPKPIRSLLSRMRHMKKLCLC